MDVKQSTLGAVLQTMAQSNDAAQQTVATETNTTSAAQEITTDNNVSAEAAVTETPADTTVQPEGEETVAFDMPVFESQEQPQPEAQQQVVDWREALKANRDEALKELGLDPFAVELNEYIKKGGKPVDYLNAKAIDWKAVPDADLIKQDLKQKFPQATAAQIDLFFNKKYNQFEDAEDEDKQLGLMLLMSDADEARKVKIANQQQFKIPDAVQQQQQQVQVNPEVEAAQQKQQEFFTKIIQSDATKNLFQSKRVAIDLGEGVKPVNVSINPQQLLDVLFKPEVFAKIGRTPQGEPDVQFWHEFGLFCSNHKLYKSLVRGNPKELAKKELVEEGRNAQRPAQVVPTNTNQYNNHGEAFSKGQIREVKLGSYR